MSIQMIGLILAATVFVVFAAVIMYKTSKIDGNPTGEWNEWSEVADNEGD